MNLLSSALVLYEYGGGYIKEISFITRSATMVAGNGPSNSIFTSAQSIPAMSYTINPYGTIVHTQELLICSMSNNEIVSVGLGGTNSNDECTVGVTSTIPPRRLQRKTGTRTAALVKNSTVNVPEPGATTTPAPSSILNSSTPTPSSANISLPNTTTLPSTPQAPPNTTTPLCKSNESYCLRGTCGNVGCVCPAFYAGPRCDVCNEGYHGDTCTCPTKTVAIYGNPDVPFPNVRNRESLKMLMPYRFV
eukprot:PhF_6_TR11742/c0_g1_i2/m.19199